MLKWSKFIAVLIAGLFLVTAAAALMKANQPFSKVKKAALEVVQKEQALETIEDIDIFHGDVSIISVFGTDKEGSSKIVIVDEASAKIITAVAADKGISKSQAVDFAKADERFKEMHHVTLGLIGQKLVWEVSYIRQNGSLNYFYLNFADGVLNKRIVNI